MLDDLDLPWAAPRQETTPDDEPSLSPADFENADLVFFTYKGERLVSVNGDPRLISFRDWEKQSLAVYVQAPNPYPDGCPDCGTPLKPCPPHGWVCPKDGYGF